ncbi:MAG: PPC domain-containing DNA-binding protein [Candidatus Thorarchaeota archaeon]
MKYCQTQGTRILTLALKKGDDLLESVQQACEKKKIYGGSIISGIGALSQCYLGYFDLDSREYRTITINEPVELVNTSGTITLTENGKAFPHIHLIVANSKSQCFGGHAMSGCLISVTAELMVLGFEKPLTRKLDPETNLMLLDPD